MSEFPVKYSYMMRMYDGKGKSYNPATAPDRVCDSIAGKGKINYNVTHWSRGQHNATCNE